MKQNRTDRQGGAGRKSRMEQAEGSREHVRGSAGGGSDHGSRSGQRSSIGERLRETERMRGEEGSPGGESQARRGASRDLGTSSDRAMFNEDLPDRSSESSGSSKTGGITNRELDREQREQDQLPERGRSQSER